MPGINSSTRPVCCATALVLTALVASVFAGPAAATELRVERTGETVSSLQPEDFPPPPGAPISPLRLTEAASDWPHPISRSKSKKRKEQQGPKGAATCKLEFNASIVSGGERGGRLSRIQMSYELVENPRRLRYRWKLAKDVERCKYRIYLEGGRSLTYAEPTYMDSRTGYYDHYFEEDRRHFRMIVWGRMAKRSKSRGR